MTHASHGQAGTGTDEHPYAPYPQNARRPRTKLASAILGVVRFSDRFGAIKVLDSTTGTVTLELTTWER